VTTDLETIINNHLPIVSSGNKVPVKQLPIDTVDQYANSLVEEYDNTLWRKWYCGVIYEFGPSRVEEWRVRAKDGKEPAKLFSLYVSQARKYHKQNQ